MSVDEHNQNIRTIVIAAHSADDDDDIHHSF